MSATKSDSPTRAGAENPDPSAINRRAVLTTAAGAAGLVGAVGLAGSTAIAGPDQGGQTLSAQRSDADGSVAEPQRMARALQWVWNHPVDPARHPGAKLRPQPPVTWEDLGGENICHTYALRQFKIEWPRVVDYKETLDLYTKAFNFGAAVNPKWELFFTENYQEVVDEIKARGLILHQSWGYEPWYGRAETDPKGVPPEAKSYLEKTLGGRFTGFDNGEHDHSFVRNEIEPATANPQEVFERFLTFEARINSELMRNTSVTCNTTFPHYMADIGDSRMIGCQIAQSKPNVPMWCGMLRGACKQYGLLYWAAPSEYNRWGWRGQGADYTEVEGTSVSLLHRLWHIAYMYGTAFLGNEAPDFLADKTTTVMVDGAPRQAPVPDPVARQQLEITNWFRKHPDRGVMHTPVAILWDFLAGWVPPGQCDIDRPYSKWGAILWGKGDFQIDALFRELFPGYELASYYRDERGFLTTTPWGDSYDVLLSNTPRFVLNRYNAAVVIGPTRIEGQLQTTLEDFLARGGSVATTAAQLTPDSARMFGVRLAGKTMAERYSSLRSGLAFSEAEFTRHVLQPMEGAEVLARTYTGEPLVVRRIGRNGAETLLFAADFGVTNKLAEPTGYVNDHTPIVSPHLMLEHVRAILMPWMAQWNLVEVEGPPIQFLVNLTKAQDTFNVTLCNNTPFPWNGSVRFKGARIAGGMNWMTDEKFGARDAIRLAISPLNVVVLELRTDRPMVLFTEDRGPPPTAAELERKSGTFYARLMRGTQGG